MKVQCDVCGREEAAVFCCADEAALCNDCDRRVHRANKLAGKHCRLSLLVPSPQAHPLCDVCQERRGFVFCQQDRAILCGECDDPIHSANHLTSKHNRFLLAGVRLSAAPLSSSGSDSSSREVDEVGKDGNKQGIEVPKANQGAALVPESSILCNKTTATPSSAPAASATASNGSGGNGSSISDYLIKVCPGWHVEDLLVDDAAAAAAAAASGKDLLSFVHGDLDGGGGGLVPAAPEIPMWVPDVPHMPRPLELHGGIATHLQSPGLGFNEMSPQYPPAAKAGRDRWSIDDALTVPQIRPASHPGKRARQHMWYY